MLMLEKVRYTDHSTAVDVEALTDGYAYDQYSCVYLLSVAGRDSNVKAISSAVASGRQVEILAPEPVAVRRAYGQKYRIMSGKLPNGVLHQVVAAEGFFRSPSGRHRLLYVEGHDDVPGFVFEAVRSMYPVPVIPEWSGWLYEKLAEREHLEELRGTRKVLRLTVAEEELDALISEGVRNGEITF